MNRKVITACVIVLGLLTFFVIRSGKRVHHSEPPRDNFSLTVDLPKTNKAGR